MVSAPVSLCGRNESLTMQRQSPPKSTFRYKASNDSVGFQTRGGGGGGPTELNITHLSTMNALLPPQSVNLARPGSPPGWCRHRVTRDVTEGNFQPSKALALLSLLLSPHSRSRTRTHTHSSPQSTNTLGTSGRHLWPPLVAKPYMSVSVCVYVCVWHDYMRLWVVLHWWLCLFHQISTCLCTAERPFTVEAWAHTVNL